MPAKHTHNIAFTDLHYQILEDIRKNTNKSFAEIIRILLDDLIDRSPDVVLEYQRKTIKGLERDLELSRDHLASLERIATEKPLFERIESAFDDKVPQTGKQKWSLSGHDEFAHFVTRLGSEGALGRVAIKKVRTYLHDHPEWLPEIAEDKRHFVEEQQ